MSSQQQQKLLSTSSFRFPALGSSIDIIPLTFANGNNHNKQLTVLDLVDKTITGIAQLDFVALFRAMKSRGRNFWIFKPLREFGLEL